MAASGESCPLGSDVSASSIDLSELTDFELESVIHVWSYGGGGYMGEGRAELIKTVLGLLGVYDDVEEDEDEDESSEYDEWVAYMEDFKQHSMEKVVDASIDGLIKLLAIEKGRIEYLSLASGYDINDEQVARLMKHLHNYPHLRRLSFMSCQIRTAGAQAIGWMLSENTSLKDLNLVDCRFANRGAEGLVVGLMKNTTLQRLNLNGNGIRRDGLAHFVDLFRRSETGLIDLILFNNRFQECHCEDLLATLEEVRLRGYASSPDTSRPWPGKVMVWVNPHWAIADKFKAVGPER